MKRIKTALLALALCISSFVQAIPANPVTDKTLTASEAKDHIGEKATVCGTVASTRYAASSKGPPTFVNIDKPYPNQVFTILIWGEDLPKFNVKPSTWEGKWVCATGTISSYRGVPEIVAKSPDQITFPKASSQMTTPQTPSSTLTSCPSSDCYVNSAGQSFAGPVQSDTPPAGTTVECRDGTYSSSQSRRGTCSHHEGIVKVAVTLRRDTRSIRAGRLAIRGLSVN